MIIKLRQLHLLSLLPSNFLEIVSVFIANINLHLNCLWLCEYNIFTQYQISNVSHEVGDFYEPECIRPKVYIVLDSESFKFQSKCSLYMAINSINTILVSFIRHLYRLLNFFPMRNALERLLKWVKMLQNFHFLTLTKCNHTGIVQEKANNWNKCFLLWHSSRLLPMHSRDDIYIRGEYSICICCDVPTWNFSHPLCYCYTQTLNANPTCSF